VLKIEAVIAAAGLGLRMNSRTRKQFMPLEGIPVIARSVNLFQGYPNFGKIVLGIAAGDEDRVRSVIEPHCSLEKVELAVGGISRQESVFRGLQLISPDCDLVCIHDAARPLATRALLERLIAAAVRYDAAVPVIALHDTVKEINADQMVVATPPRDRLRSVQTPQVFKAGLIRRVYREAFTNQIEATDDASLVELCSGQVAVVEGELSNLKITTLADFALANWYLKGVSQI